jgi:NAD(P)-dependent dehydrogenase (short-subunit alcohol dehydrogenase family)
MVVTASTGGLRPFGGDPFYAMTKWAVVGFVRSVAPALTEEGIALHGLCPGLTDTAFLGPLRDRLVQLGAPMLTPADVAAAVLTVAASPLESSGTVWLLEDPSSPGPQPYRFHDLQPNATSAHISALLRGG